ncbi:Solute carrier family 40 member 1 [Portunus trituberculatus]|uniref:Solute carrier family 40 member n=1 Tax=Portunus trituberculatus TaxID=210409 RepID=A0A5B7CVA3_PORTR|nr:Solute carrier family 40 member 1 [Portunus trituberculatus]
MTATSGEAVMECPKVNVAGTEDTSGDTSRSRVAAVAPCPSSGLGEGEGGGGLDTEEKGNSTVCDDAGGSGGATGKGVEGEGEEEARWWCCHCFNERLQVYASHFLSSWGDRMWMFAGGIFLLEVTPGSLRLAAIYGAALALTVIVLGAPVGRWVDRTSRLRAAQLSLSVQNLMVCLCAALLVLITSSPDLFRAWDGWALVLGEVSL